MFLTILIALVAIGTLTYLYFKPEIDACFERDPSTANLVEILLTYSGLHALIAHRISHQLYVWQIPLLPRLISYLAKILTGVEIHPAVKIGKGCFIDHGAGIVIGETTVLGENVTLYQGVTLGGTGKEKGKRHPTIGNNVVVGAGAKVLGNIQIGNGSMVGANAVVIRDVPENATVVGVPGRMAKSQGLGADEISLNHSGLPDPLTQSLQGFQKKISDLEAELRKLKEQTSSSQKHS